MKATGNPGGGEPRRSAEPADDYGYSGDYGYGPGYGDPDGGAGHSYGQPADEDPATENGTGAHAEGVTGGDPAAGAAVAPQSLPAEPLPPVVADTPALRGYPGEPGIGEPADGADTAGSRDAHGLTSPSVWQQAQRAWLDAGVEWQRPVADTELAETEWERVQAEPPGSHLDGITGAGRGILGRRRAARSLARIPGSPLKPPGGEFLPTDALPPLNPRVAPPPGTGTGAAVATPADPPAPSAPAAGMAGLGDAAVAAPAAGMAGREGAGLTAPAAAMAGREDAGVTGGPADATRSSPFRAATRPGGMRTGIAVLVVIAIGLLAYVVFGGTGGKTGPSPLGPYPPARLAGADFSTDPGQAARGIFQSVAAVADSGSTIVAIGTQTGQWVPRAQFFVSPDSGRDWQLATVHGPGGAAPSPAEVPLLLAGGPSLPGGSGGWLALGTGAAWTSADGKTWTLAPGAGISPQPGDRVLALARTGTGFVAVGQNVPVANQAASIPVAWTSADGLTWRRLAGSSLSLPAAGGHVLGLTRVAARGSHVLVEGPVMSTRGHGKRRASTLSDGLWLSPDGGSSWTALQLPGGGASGGAASSGGAGLIDGVTATGSGFVVIRPGSSASNGPDAIAYVSAGGSSWTRTATITAAKAGHLQVTNVGGSDHGAAVSGVLANGARVAYASTDGRSWHAVASPGSAAQTLAGATVTSGGTVVVGGASARPGGTEQQPYLVLAGTQAAAVNFAAIPGATGAALNVSAIAAAGRAQVAVGTANGYPAIWTAAGSGRWRRAGAAVLDQPGLGALAGVAHGARGWLAVGAVTTGAPGHPIVAASPDGTAWRTAGGQPAFAGPGIGLNQAAAGPSGYVIVGRQVIPPRTVTKTTVVRHRKHVTTQVIPARTIAAAWWSGDLASWSRGTGASPADLAGSGSPQMLAVTAARTGFVAVGSAGQAPAPAAWTSPDGKTWTRTSLRLPAGANSAQLQRVAARGGLIVATGTATAGGGPAPFAAWSADGGTSWRETPLRAPGGFAAVTALTAAGRGFEAAGTVGQPGSQRVVVWSSRDGITWTAREPRGTGLSGPGSHAITALAASGRQVTGAGYVATPLTEHPTLWRAAAAAG